MLLLPQLVPITRLLVAESGCKGSEKKGNDQIFLLFFSQQGQKNVEKTKKGDCSFGCLIFILYLCTLEMRRILFLFIISMMGTVVTIGQQPLDSIPPMPPSWREPVPEGWPTLKKASTDIGNALSKAFKNAFYYWDISVTTGSTGIGFDVSTPMNSVLSLRAGYAFMPHWKQPMHFGVEVGDDRSKSHSKFERLSGLLQDFTGYQVDNEITMEGMPTYWNWKLMADVTPFRNKHWHLTAGFYAGSHQIGKAVNAIEDMPSLMAVTMYNNVYNKAANDQPITNINGADIFLEDPTGKMDLKSHFLYYGMMSIHMGNYTHDVLYEEDVVSPYDQFIGDNHYAEGDIIHHKGDVMIAKGSPYRMVPDENSMVKAYAYANRFKPYVGFGYGGQLLKGDDSWLVSFDCGAMFWGGVPKIVTHDGTDLVNDVENVRGKVGDYIDVIKKFKVFPVLNLRITKRLF